MLSLTATIDVSQSREVVYDFLDVHANHALFTDHMMRDWQFEGPARGVGSKVRVNAVLGGRTEPVEIEVVATDPPALIVERNIGAGGRRVATGTYSLAELPGRGTRISFEYAWQRIPMSERLAFPIVRIVMRRALRRSMHRLAEQLPEQVGTREPGDQLHPTAGTQYRPPR